MSEGPEASSTDTAGTATTSRRAFLAGALATAGAAMLDPRHLAAARRRAAALPTGELFPLGVASGDPTDDAVILWTRLVAPEGGAGLGSGDIAVDWELASDDSFSDVVASGTAPGVADLGHSVHVDVDGLEPATWYWYRFSVDGRTSPVGRTRTVPGAGTMPEETRFVLATCQRIDDGTYTAHANIAAEDIELVVFVGDYIYEYDVAGLPEATDLAGYRAHYELYKTNADLQAAHHHVPWVVTLDDHEVVNNMIRDLGSNGELEGDPAAIEAFRARRADAYQAWYEHQPLRLPPPEGPDYRIHRIVEHSDLLRFFVLDGRQYRSTYASENVQGPSVPERFAESQTMLGTDQEAWLDDALADTTARWNAVAQQTVMTATPIPVGDATFYNYDQWDGYVAARRRLLESLARHGVANPMVLSGDIHLAAAGALRLDYDDPDAADVAYEVVTTSISSTFSEDLLPIVQQALDDIPWATYANGKDRGYARITVTPDQWRTDFRVVDTSVAASEATTDHTEVIANRVLDEPPPGDPPPGDPPPGDPGRGPGGPPDGPGAAPDAAPASPVPGRADFTG